MKTKWNKQLALTEEEFAGVLEMRYKNHSRYYLGYGSNLNVLQMQTRCKHALPLASCDLPDHKLVFSDVATVEPCEGSVVPSAVWRVSASDIYSLDSYEGYPHLYDKRTVTLNIKGNEVECFYYILDIDYKESTPCQSYYKTVAEGYEEWGLDLDALVMAEANAENIERDRNGSIMHCDFCDELFRFDDLRWTRLYGDVCQSCYQTLVGGDRYYKGQAYADKWDDDIDWGTTSFNPGELDWTGKSDVIDTRFNDENDCYGYAG